MSALRPLAVESLESRLVPTVVPPAAICGSVYVDGNCNGLRDCGEAGVGQVTVNLLSADTKALVKTAMTGFDGHYHFDNLPAGTYKVVEVQPPGYHDGLESKGGVVIPNTAGTDCVEVTVSAGQTVCDVNFGEKPCAPPPPETTGREGLTPGYWKNNAVKHSASAWAPTGYFQYQTLGSVFDLAGTPYAGLANKTLVQALSFEGGGANALLRHAVAAVLNASHPEVDYPLTTTQIISQVNAALASGDAARIEGLKNTLDTYNNLGADLDQHGRAI